MIGLHDRIPAIVIFEGRLFPASGWERIDEGKLARKPPR